MFCCKWLIHEIISYACHVGGRGFEPRRPRQFFSTIDCAAANPDSNDLWIYSIDASGGALTPVTGAPFATYNARRQLGRLPEGKRPRGRTRSDPQFAIPVYGRLSVTRNFGAFRALVACSKAYAYLMSFGSLQAVPMKVTPTGSSPKAMPAVTVTSG